MEVWFEACPWPFDLESCGEQQPTMWMTSGSAMLAKITVSTTLKKADLPPRATPGLLLPEGVLKAMQSVLWGHGHCW